VGAVEDVVAERKRAPVWTDEVASDDERLRQPFGRRLDGISDAQAEVGAIAEQPFEPILLVRRRDHENVPDA
jgi:hypothetical protein